ncbi:uncharacterized protein [Procambarus clarkii]|uniref:uncharacterized protein n=1 Tax=Procambarus clarkii TaxID=6728 RepID=UPI00374449CA
MPESILRKLLLACTKKAPFVSPDGHMYKQVDGVAMGSPLGVLFANIYMGTIEQRVLVDMGWKPAMYCRYIDDIFTQVPDARDLQQLKEAFEQISVLSFTYERENNGKLPFLDVTVMERIGGFHTAVYTKETNIGISPIVYAAPMLALVSEKMLGGLEKMQNEAMKIILGCPRTTISLNTRKELDISYIDNNDTFLSHGRLHLSKYGIPSFSPKKLIKEQALLRQEAKFNALSQIDALVSECSHCQIVYTDGSLEVS